MQVAEPSGGRRSLAEINVADTEWFPACGGFWGTAAGTVQVATAKSFLVTCALAVADEEKHKFDVSAAAAACGRSVREAAAVATAPWRIIELSRGIDQQSWFVELHRAPA